MYLEAIKGHSELSVIEYASDLRTFFRYLAKEKNLYPPDTPDDQMDLRQINMDFIKTITLSDAYQFLIYCKNQRGNAEATRARRVIAIRRFNGQPALAGGKSNESAGRAENKKSPS